MTLQELRMLLDFHYWARDRVLTAIDPLSPEQFARDLGNSFRSIRDTVSHIYFAEWVWHSRWQGHSPTGPPPDPFPDQAAVRNAWVEHEAKVRSFLEGLGDQGINRVFEYKMLNGHPGASVFWHMLQHVVNHATYHRGQVTTMLRQLGAPPPKSTDLITFYRDRQQ